MAIASKRIRKARELINPELKYSLNDAIGIFQEYRNNFTVKFDESVEVAIKLNLDPKQADQMVRGAVTMPHGLGKTIKVAVIAGPECMNEAKAAGADMYGSDEFIEEIKNGRNDFDVIISHPNMMIKLAKVGRILGPLGKMPNIKLGTVTEDIANAVKNAKSGQVEYKVEKSGIVHAAVGKISFGVDEIKENIVVLYNALLGAKPSGAKGVYVKNFCLSSSMGPSIVLDLDSISG